MCLRMRGQLLESRIFLHVMSTGEHNSISKLMPQYYQHYWHINILEREAQIDASGKVSKEQCHCSSAKVGMGVAS